VPSLDALGGAAWREAVASLGRPKIAITGFAGAGKSMLVNTLFGAKVASVNARAGWTTVPQFVEHNLFELIDTPGFGSDGWDEPVFLAQILEPADLVLHLINAAAGVTDYDREMFALVRSHPGLVVALNKVDLLDDDELVEAVDGIMAVLPLAREHLVAISGKRGTGLDLLVAALTERLPRTLKSNFIGSLSSKRFTEQRVAFAKDVVHYYSAAAGVIGTVPIPIADIAALAPLQIAMFLHVSRIFGHDFTKEQATSVIGSLVGSLGARSAAQAVVSVVKGIPGIGSVLGAAAGGTMAAGTFEAFGNIVIRYFEDQQKISPRDVRKFYAAQYERAKRTYCKPPAED